MKVFEDGDDCKVILMKMNDEDDDDDDSTESNYGHVIPNTVIKSFPINGRPCNSSADRFRLTQFDINLTQPTRLNPTLYSIQYTPSSLTIKIMLFQGRSTVHGVIDTVRRALTLM